MLCYHNGIWQKGIKAVVNTLNQIKFYLCSTSRTQGIIRRCSDDDSNLMWSFQVAEQEKWNLKTRIKQLDKSFQLLINIHVKLWFYSSRSHHLCCREDSRMRNVWTVIRKKKVCLWCSESASVGSWTKRDKDYNKNTSDLFFKHRNNQFLTHFMTHFLHFSAFKRPHWSIRLWIAAV